MFSTSGPCGGRVFSTSKIKKELLTKNDYAKNLSSFAQSTIHKASSPEKHPLKKLFAVAIAKEDAQSLTKMGRNPFNVKK